MPKKKKRRSTSRIKAISGRKGPPPPKHDAGQGSADQEECMDVHDMLEFDTSSDELEKTSRAHFLATLKPGELRTDKKRLKRTAKETGVPDSKRARREEQREETPSSEEAEFERTPRTSTWEVKGEEKGLHYLLPLKAKQGRLIQQEPTHLESSTGGAGEESDASFQSLSSHSAEVTANSGDNEGADSASKVLSEAELFLQSQERLASKEEAISLACSQLMENPEANISQLKLLRGFCVDQDPDEAVEIRKLAMRSFANVVKDIAPSYHIRELTDAERAVKVSKDVKRIRHFEQTLLLDYQHFLSQCDDTIKVGLNVKGQKGGEQKRRRRNRKKPVVLLESGKELSSVDMEILAEVALGCMCDLLVSLPHFNFRNNLLASLVPLMPSKKLEGEVSKMCCTAIESLFRSDSVGEVSFQAVQLIAKMVKAKSYNTKPAVLQTFLHLRLQDVDDPVAAAGTASNRQGRKTKEERKKEAKQKLTKKQKRRLQAEAQLDKDLLETSAVESKEKRSKMQTEVLKVVFLTYFRILKNSRHSPLLGPVLEGLAKFAHLINVDFFADLMNVLHSLAETGGLTNKECMQCVLTAFEILSGQGSALNIDPREFYTRLYGAILCLDARSLSCDVLLAMDCLDKLLRNQRQVSTQRVLGFVKRLATVSLQLQPAAALAVLATIKKFMQCYSQCEQLLDVDAVTGSGVYRPDVPDPEMSSASSTSLWELADLRLHYDPAVTTYALHLLHGAPSHGKQTLTPELARKTPKEFLSLHLDSSKLPVTFEPMASTPRPLPHPALKLAQKKRGGYQYKDLGILCPYVKEKVEEATEETTNY